jgi:hypothetical protein
MCPMLDDRNVTVSSRQFETGTLWSRKYNLMGWAALLGRTPGGSVSRWCVERLSLAAQSQRGSPGWPAR